MERIGGRVDIWDTVELAALADIVLLWLVLARADFRATAAAFGSDGCGIEMNPAFRDVVHDARKLLVRFSLIVSIRLAIALVAFVLLRPAGWFLVGLFLGGQVTTTVFTIANEKLNRRMLRRATPEEASALTRLTRRMDGG